MDSYDENGNKFEEMLLLDKYTNRDRNANNSRQKSMIRITKLQINRKTCRIDHS